MNTNLDITNHLPHPLEVIEIDDDNDVVFILSPDFGIPPPPTPIKSPKLNLTLHKFLPHYQLIPLLQNIINLITLMSTSC